METILMSLMCAIGVVVLLVVGKFFMNLEKKIDDAESYLKSQIFKSFSYLSNVHDKLYEEIIFSDKQTKEQLKEIAEQIADLRTELLEKLDTVKLHSALSPSEVEYLEKQRRFDERIQRLQEELSKTSHIVRKGVEAETLHPGVYNIPHEAVDGKIREEQYPSVEYAE